MARTFAATSRPKLCRSRGDETQTFLTAKHRKSANGVLLETPHVVSYQKIRRRAVSVQDVGVFADALRRLWRVMDCAGRAKRRRRFRATRRVVSPKTVRPCESGVALRLPPPSKTRAREYRGLTNCAERLGLRQPSGALFVVTALGKDLRAAQAAACAAVECIQFEGA
jgi:hypothetical protein